MMGTSFAAAALYIFVLSVFEVDCIVAYLPLGLNFIHVYFE